MRFEVVDRREERRGFIKKRTEYYCVVNLDFTDEELATLNEMCREKAYELEDVGTVQVVAAVNAPFEYTLGEIAKSATKNGGVFSFHVQQFTAESREVIVEQLKDVAKIVKKRLEIVQHVNAVGDSDTSEEL